MTRLLIVAVVLLGVFAGGIGIGWKAASESAATHAAAQAQAALQDTVKTVTQRTDETIRHNAAEQARSAAWLAQRGLATLQARALQEQIDHATFTVPVRPGAGEVPATCSVESGDIGGAEFVRLYNAAARAGQPAAATTTRGPD